MVPPTGFKPVLAPRTYTTEVWDKSNTGMQSRDSERIASNALSATYVEVRLAIQQSLQR